MSGFSNPIIGGGGSLVYPSMHSPDFVHDTSGWSINKDGSAEFQSITVPPGSGGARVFIQATAPASPNTGDLWVQTSSGQEVAQWSGSAWVPFQWGTGSISAGAITAALIAANTITGANIAADTIGASNLRAASITAGQIAVRTILASNIVEGTITSKEIAASTITAANIAAGTITAALLEAGIVVAGIVDGTTITGAILALLTPGGLPVGGIGVNSADQMNVTPTGGQPVVFSRGAAAGLTHALIESQGDIAISASGSGLAIAQGSNARIGRSTLSGGTVTVANTSVTASTVVLLTPQSNGANSGAVSATTNPGVGFTIKSNDASDGNNVAWVLIEVI